MKRIKALIIMLLLPLMVYAYSVEDVFSVMRAYAASVASSYVALSSVELPGVDIKNSGSFIPDEITLENADLSSFKAELMKKSFLPLSIVRPFASNAVSYIDRVNPPSGGYIASGTIRIEKSNDISLARILTFDFASIELIVTFQCTLYGTMLEEKVPLSGAVIVKGRDDGTVLSEFDSLKIGNYIVKVPPVISSFRQ